LLGAFSVDDEDPDGDERDGISGGADAGFPKFVLVVVVPVPMVV